MPLGPSSSTAKKSAPETPGFSLSPGSPPPDINSVVVVSSTEPPPPNQPPEIKQEVVSKPTQPHPPPPPPASAPVKSKFCGCVHDEWNFKELREEILLSQRRACPRCHEKFKNIIIIEKTLTPSSLLLTWQGVLVVVVSLLQHSIFFFAALLAAVDVSLAAQHDLLHTSRTILLVLTIVFLVATCVNMGRAIYRTAGDVCDQLDDKVIADVLHDLHPQ